MSADAERALHDTFRRYMAAPGWANYRDIESLFVRAMRKRSVRVGSAAGVDRNQMTQADINAALQELITAKEAEQRSEPLVAPTTLHARATAHTEAATPQHEHAAERVEEHAHEHAHGVEHEHGLDFSHMYDTEARAAFDALDHVRQTLSLDRKTILGMAAGNIPPAALDAMAERMHVSREEALHAGSCSRRRKKSKRR